jgi:hypothetical protein
VVIYVYSQGICIGGSEGRHVLSRRKKEGVWKAMVGLGDGVFVAASKAADSIYEELSWYGIEGGMRTGDVL